MPTLPSEIISLIMKLAAPPPTFALFRERSSILRSFALVCSAWRGEAQRLLWRDVVIERTRDQAKRHSVWPFTLEEGPANLQTLSLRLSIRPTFYTPMSKKLSVDAMAASQRLTQNLVHLAFRGGMEIDPLILSYFPLLRSLSLYDTQFYHFSPPGIDFVLQHLTDLSIKEVNRPIPSCLLPSRLPALKRLAFHGGFWHVIEPDEVNEMDQMIYEPEYTMEGIAALLPRIEFFICESQDKTFWNSRYGMIAYKTLFDLRAWERDGEEYEPLNIKHVRIQYQPYWDLEDEIAESEAIENVVQNFEKIVRRFPELETMVVSRIWSKFASFEAGKALLDNKGIALILEDEEHGAFGESIITGELQNYGPLNVRRR